MKIYQTSLLNKFSNITHGFTAKNDGISKEPYSSLNLAFHVNDDADLVEMNHTLLADELNYDKNRLIHMKQIHSNIVHTVTDKDNFNNPPVCDALITNKPDIALMVMVADCSPILFYDDKQKVIAVAHAGRQGAFKNIVKNVIESFKNNFNSSVNDIYVSIGANIRECCYEVGSEIYEEAKDINLDYSIEKRDNSFFLNIDKILQTQLDECGIKKENIEISKECTCCQNSKYFSYRADGITGRFCGLIKLN